MEHPSARDEVLRRLAPESHFYRLFDSLPDVLFFAKDAEGRLLFADVGLHYLYGFAREDDLVGLTDFDLLPRELAKKYRSDDLRVMSTQVPSLGIVEIFLSPQGIPRWHVTDKMPMRAIDGSVLGVMGTIRPHADGGDGLLDERLRPAVQRMRDDLTRDDPIAELSTLCGISTRQFENRFKRIYGISPSTYRIRLRLTRACELLIGSDSPITQVALEAGFYDQSALARRFRAVMGMTPQQYRRRYAR